MVNWFRASRVRNCYNQQGYIESSLRSRENYSHSNFKKKNRKRYNSCKKTTRSKIQELLLFIFLFLSRRILLWIELPWPENPVDTYARHAETLDIEILALEVIIITQMCIFYPFSFGSAISGRCFVLLWWRSRYTLLMRPNKVATAVQCCAYVFAGFSGYGNSIFNYYSVHEWPGRPRSNPKSSHTKESKMVLDADLLNTRYYEVLIKSSVD